MRYLKTVPAFIKHLSWPERVAALQRIADEALQRQGLPHRVEGSPMIPRVCVYFDGYGWCVRANFDDLPALEVVAAKAIEARAGLRGRRRGRPGHGDRSFPGDGADR